MGDDNSGSDQLEKQEENKLPVPNPEGKGGFADNPQNINKNGRPPKGWAWSEILEDIGETVEPTSKKTYKVLVGERLWLECMQGNVLAIKELFNRMEGLPRMKLDADIKVDMKIPELIDRIDKMLGLSNEEVHTTSDTDNQGNS